MTTTVVKTIGTATRDYSTIALWWAGCPANLVTVDQIWEGDCYNDSEFLITSGITLSGVTTSTTQYPHLTTGSGQSFADNANKTTNALRYNQSNGVGVRTTTGYIIPLTVSVPNFHMDKLQWYRNSNSGSDQVISGSGQAGTTYNQLIIESDTTGVAVLAMINAGTCTIANSLICCRGNGAGTMGIDAGYPGTGTGIFNCTVVKPSDSGGNGTGIRNRGGGFSNLQVEDCAVFGWGTTGSAGTYATGSDYNGVADATSPFGGTHNQTSLTYASQFQVVTNATRDFRALSTGSLNATGLADSTHTGGIDIVGQTRSVTTPTIGAFEIVSGGGGNVSVTLTGQAATGSAGSLTAALALSLSGSVGTTNAGTLVAAIDKALTGLGLTTSAGTLVPGTTVTLTGIQLTSSAGTLTVAGQATGHYRVTKYNGVSKTPVHAGSVSRQTYDFVVYGDGTVDVTITTQIDKDLRPSVISETYELTPV